MATWCADTRAKIKRILPSSSLQRRNQLAKIRLSTNSADSGTVLMKRTPGPGGRMKIGVPKEVKNHEYRVAITPIGVHELAAHGHEVYVEKGAGVGSQIDDAEFVAA